MMGALCSSWWPLDWVAVAVVLLSTLYLYLTWNFNYWKDRGILYIKPKLFFGSIKDSLMAKKTLGHVYQDIYRELDGESFGGFFKFRQPALLLRDPELIKSVLVREFSSFHDNDFHVDINVDPLFGRNPFVLQGDPWKTVRSHVTQGFTAGKMKAMFPLMLEACHELADYLEKEASSGVETKDVTAKLATDVVATCAYGIQGNAFKDPNDEFRRMGLKYLYPNFFKFIQQTCFILLPKLATLLKFKMVPQDVGDFFREVLGSAMKYRQQSGVKRNDFLQLLISTKEKFNANNHRKDLPWFEKFTDEDVAAQALTFFTDGYETSSTALTYLLYELAMNPDLQVRLREEVDEVVEQNDGEISFDSLQQMHYLEMMMLESMRKHPPIMFMTRLCTKPFDLPKANGGMLRVEVGTPVVTPILALHHDPDIYPNPELFDPERFAKDGVQTMHQFAYLPFGEGPRICPGMRFGKTLIKGCVALLVSRFDLKPTSKTPTHIRPNPESFFLMPLDDVWIQFVKRTN